MYYLSKSGLKAAPFYTAFLKKMNFSITENSMWPVMLVELHSTGC